jgi:hypothetical protein
MVVFAPVCVGHTVARVASAAAATRRAMMLVICVASLFFGMVRRRFVRLLPLDAPGYNHVVQAQARA